MKLSRLIEPARWRSVWAFLGAMLAHRKGDFATSLTAYDKALELESFRTAERMAFYVHLLVLNGKPAEQTVEICKKIAAGEYSKRARDSRYARALARYWLAYLSNQPDVVALWLEAYRLKPKKGWASRVLHLPDKPLLK